MTVTARRILVVEDDPNIAELLAFMLEQAGHQVTVLADGRAAEAHLRTAPPADLAVFDAMLPYRDGYTLTRVTRSLDSWRTVPILMLTAKSLPADIARGQAVGITVYLTKPFEPEDLLARIRDLLEGQA